MDKGVYSDDTYQLDIRIENIGRKYCVTALAGDFEEKSFFLNADEVQGILGRCQLLESYLSHPQTGRFSGDIINLGIEISQRFVQPYPHFKNAAQCARSHNMPILINIRSSDHNINLIQWELLYSEEFGFLALGPWFQLIRTPIDGARDAPELPAGPLRVLFMACSPDGTDPVLNYEREEEIILDALADLKRTNELEIDIAEGGTLAELEEMLARRPYHVVHLSSHGEYDRKTRTGYLLMEGESGMQRRVSAQELAEKLIGIRPVRLLFLSACQSGSETAQNTGLAQSMIAGGIPMVIGMKHPVLAAIIRITNISALWILTGEGEMFESEEQKILAIPPEDLPKEQIKRWLDDYWEHAGPDERAWIKIEMKKKFPEFTEWLKK